MQANMKGESRANEKSLKKPGRRESNEQTVAQRANDAEGKHRVPLVKVLDLRHVVQCDLIVDPRDQRLVVSVATIAL